MKFDRVAVMLGGEEKKQKQKAGGQQGVFPRVAAVPACARYDTLYMRGSIVYVTRLSALMDIKRCVRLCVVGPSSRLHGLFAEASLMHCDK